MKTGLLLETRHMTTSFWRQRRESLGTRLSTWSIKIMSFTLNNFAPEKFFRGGPKRCWWTVENSRIRPRYEGVFPICCFVPYTKLPFSNLYKLLQTHCFCSMCRIHVNTLHHTDVHVPSTCKIKIPQKTIRGTLNLKEKSNLSQSSWCCITSNNTY